MADKKLLESSQNMLATEKSEVKSLDTMQGSSVLSKANIFERSVVIDGKWVDEKVSSDCPSIAAFWKDRAPGLTKSLASALPLLKISKLDELKLQFNAGSKGCFPMVGPSGHFVLVLTEIMIRFRLPGRSTSTQRCTRAAS